VFCPPVFGQPPDANVTAQRAVVGNGSGSGGSSRTQLQDAVLERAFDLARQTGRASPTVEQLLLALLDDDSVRSVLVGKFIDAVSVRAVLTQYVAAQPRIEPTADDPLGRDPKTTHVLQRALLKSVADNRHPLPTDLLVAIVVEGDSFAAEALVAHGLTVDSATNAAVERYIAVQKEHEQRLADMRARIAAQSSPANSRLNQVSLGTSASGPVVAKSYTLRVSHRGPAPLRFKGALSYDGALDLYIESTPFEIRFAARQIVALFEAVDNGSLDVELITELDGVERVVSGFGGEAGAIFEDSYDRNRQSGILR
jgi:hypothetical protein